MINPETKHKIEQSNLFEKQLKKIFIWSGCILLIFSGAFIGRLLSENKRLIELNQSNKLLCYLRDKKLLKEEHDNIDLKSIYIMYLKDDAYHNKTNENGQQHQF